MHSTRCQLLVTAAAVIAVIAVVVHRGLPPSEDITHAASRGDEAEVCRAIGWGVDPNAKWLGLFSPLPHALYGRHESTARLLVESEADVNTVDVTGRFSAFQLAVEAGRVELAELMIAHGADVNAPDGSDFARTPLDSACQGHVEAAMVRLLIANGAGVNRRDANGETPLHICGSAEKAALLIAEGADVSARDDRGWTPLHMAAWGFNCRMMGFLISSGAEVKARDHDGQTPLHYVVSNESIERRPSLPGVVIMRGDGNLASARLLLDRGADVNVRDNEGRTPLDLARPAKLEQDVVGLLLRHGAKE